MPHPLLISSQSDYLIRVFDKNSHSLWQTVQIQIRWLLQKPTDLDLHCLLRQGMTWLAREGLRDNCAKRHTLYTKLSSDAFAHSAVKVKQFIICIINSKEKVVIKINISRIYWRIYIYRQLDKFNRRLIWWHFSWFSQKVGFDISCKLSPDLGLKCLPFHLVFKKQLYKKQNLGQKRMDKPS